MLSQSTKNAKVGGGEVGLSIVLAFRGVLRLSIVL